MVFSHFLMDTFSCCILLFSAKLIHITSSHLHRASQTQLSLIPSLMYYVRRYYSSPAIRSLLPCPYSIPPFVRRYLPPPPSRSHKSPAVDVSHSHEHTLQVHTVDDLVVITCRVRHFVSCSLLRQPFLLQFLCDPRAWPPPDRSDPSYVHGGRSRSLYQYRRERSSTRPLSHDWNE